MILSLKRHITVALTGGIGSGKSTVARFFAEWGADVVDADDLARQVVRPGTDGLAEVVKEFGSKILTTDGQLDRKQLGSIVFGDRKKRENLESILHPRIRALWLTLLAASKAKEQPNLIVYVVPLLFESGVAYPEIEKVILITSPQEERAKRIMARDGLTIDEALNRIAVQLPDAIKASKSDFVIANDSTTTILQERSRNVFQALFS